ncbi:Copper chaperone CopZ [Alkalibacterium subtropicum]|uniref:Copper chaperone CopZ n=2 Tax=Alkalibacterium TaxID=99906 RepID=A0A1H7WUZ9_9LACT|nr:MULTISPECIES: heavy metal-associated domain-containing protein [Alkalibacterium]GEK90237.1 copper transporter CopZ [Alkalibacterium putridalgicola]SEM25281.1 Copper chaperone CopZ [Alkalibacterium putridalgicola]SFC02801.1 Copper chaperone CopZ [Alkalibacterium subtropicum]
MRKEVTVEGMKCEGCAKDVQERISGIEGVSTVDIDLANKKVVLESLSSIDRETLDSALSETQYTVAD